MIIFFRVIRRIRKKLSTLRALRGMFTDGRCVSGLSHLSLCSRVYLYLGRPSSLPSRGETAMDQKGNAGGEEKKKAPSGCKASPPCAPSLRAVEPAGNRALGTPRPTPSLPPLGSRLQA